MSPSSQINRSIWRAYVVVGLLSLLPKAMLVGRELIIANRFGTSDQVDAYLVALLLPSLVVQVIVNAFSTALIPIYVRRREESGAAEAGKLAAHAMAFGLIALSVMMAVLYLATPFLIPLLATAFPPAKQALASNYFAWLAPLVLLQGAATMWSSLINAEKRFVGVSLLPTVTPVLAIAVLFSPLAAAGMQVVVYAMLVGAVIEAVLAGTMAFRIGLPLPHLGPIDAKLRQVFRRSAPLLVGIALMNCNLFVDQFCASLTGSGGVAMLNYGNKVVTALLALSAMPVGVAVMPFFTTLAAKEEWMTLRHSLRFWSLVIAVVAVPATAGFIALSPFIVRLFYPGFADGTLVTVIKVQQGYLLQLPFYLLGILGVQMLTALGMVRKILIIAIFSFTINLVLDLVLPRFIGLPGIALSTSIMYVCSSIVIFIVMFRWKPGLKTGMETLPSTTFSQPFLEV